MPGSLTDLVNNISDSATNLIAQLRGQNSKLTPYPTDTASVGNVLSTINKANWNNLPTPYSFAVYNTQVGGFSVSNDPNTSPFSEFQLPLAPGKINQTEHFAISIRSTQGGTVVSHSGNKYKTLIISGTTGVAPFRGAGGVVKSTGAAIAKPNKLQYYSGFEVFQQLRNYFKAYYEFKKTYSYQPGTQGLRLVFKNYKDGEFLIVELLDFQMDRQAPRSFLYDYNLTFKVLGTVNFATPKSNLTAFETALATVSQDIDIARGALLGAQDILRQIAATYNSLILDPLRQISLAVKAFQGIGSTAADLKNQILDNTLTALSSLGILAKVQAMQTQIAIGANPASTVTIPNGLNVSKILSETILPTDLTSATSNNPAQAVINLGPALLLLTPTDFPATTQTQFAADVAYVQTLPRSFYADTLNSLQTFKDNAEDYFGLTSPAYDTLFDRTITVPPLNQQSITDAQFDVLTALNQSMQAVQSVLATNNLFKSTWTEQISYMNNAFAGQIDLQALPAVQQIVMPVSTDLERLAQLYLGDPTRWVEIAELNDLQSPYVIQDQSDTTVGVIHPGQNLLIPVTPTQGFSPLPVGAPITSEQLSVLEANLGTDLRLTATFDLSLGSDGDLQIISGTDNVAQAVVLKLGIEQGELIYNPTIGVGIILGGITPDLTEVRENLIKTLTQDPRISSVSNMTLNIQNDLLYLTFDLSIKQIDIPVPMNIQLP